VALGRSATASSSWLKRRESRHRRSSDANRLDSSTVTAIDSTFRLLPSNSLEGIVARTARSDNGAMQHTHDIAEVIDRFNRAFVAHDASLLVDLVADDCLMESVEPAPDGTRYDGREACLAFWQSLAKDTNGSFAPEDVVVFGDRAIIRWRYRFGYEQSVRGVNLMQVRRGKVVEALGYVKSGDRAVGDAVRKATEG
jgi:ketosteroid isomerase-like protein